MRTTPMVRWSQFIVLLAGIILIGCGPVKPLDYNDRIALGNAKLARLAKQLRFEFKPVLENKDPDRKRVRDAYDMLKTGYQEVRADVLNATVPEFASARDLRKATEDFLNHQEKLINQEIAKIVTTIEGPGKAEIKQQTITNLITAITAAEERELKKLKAAQKKFSQETNLPLKE